MKLSVKILNPLIEKWGLPKNASSGSAGMDLMACVEEPIVVTPGERALISTGISIHIHHPKFAAMILSRSGLGAKKGLTVAQGVGLIDSDYTGELMVMLLNTSNEKRTVQPGDRIAQLVLTQVEPIEWLQVSDHHETKRGAGGFGSTGVETSVVEGTL